MTRVFIVIMLLGHWVYMGTTPVPRGQTPVQSKAVADPNQYINEAAGLVQEGDIIVRLNMEPSSQFIKNFNRKDRKYSHAGIILFEKGKPFVYHIVNGSESPGGKFRKDELFRFCNWRKNLSFGIFRYDLAPGETRKLKALLHKWYSQGILFDNRFDLETDKKMYCSEMVSKALSKATSNRIQIPATALTPLEAKLLATYSKLPFDQAKKMKVIAIDELYQQRQCTTVKEYHY